jgi:hypothetical protein
LILFYNDQLIHFDEDCVDIVLVLDMDPLILSLVYLLLYHEYRQVFLGFLEKLSHNLAFLQLFLLVLCSFDVVVEVFLKSEPILTPAPHSKTM